MGVEVGVGEGVVVVAVLLSFVIVVCNVSMAWVQASSMCLSTGIYNM